MAKNTYYFSHDGNARNDDKLLAVRMNYGAEGYGVFFMILEKLMESTEYIHVKDYNIIAFDLRVSNSIVKSIVEDFDLFTFTEDGKSFYSNSFNERMEPLNNIREQRRQAGLKSAEKRAKGKDSTNDEQPLNGRSNESQRSLGENPTKERKGKESKVKDTPLPPEGGVDPIQKKLEDEKPIIPKEEKKKKLREKEKMNLQFPYQSQKFIETWEMLRGTPKWKNKIEHSLQIALNQLGRYDEEFSINQMESAIAAGWQGIVFPNTSAEYEKWRKNKTNANQTTSRFSVGAQEYGQSTV